MLKKMPTELGRKHCVKHLSMATNLMDLRLRWGQIATAYQADPVVQAYKDKLKAKMEQRK